jgi:hypothetical protein
MLQVFALSNLDWSNNVGCMRNMAIVAMLYLTNKKNDNEKEHCVEC